MKIQLPNQSPSSPTSQLQSSAKDIVFFDVETPNGKNDRICAIAAIRVSPIGQVLASRYYLVNPETHFAERNMSIHGITPLDLIDAPTFPILWMTELSQLFANADLVAHNADFDLNVLKKTLDHYDLTCPPTNCLCTKRMAQKYIPKLSGGYGLKYLASFIHVPLQHHYAMSDTEVCMQLFYYLVNVQGMNPLVEWAPYDPSIGLVGFTKSGRRYLQQLAQMETTKASLPAIVERNAIVDVAGQVFCLTGDFFHSPDKKDKIELYLIAKGADRRVNSVTRDCTLLVVGDLGSPRWKYGGYGTKIEEAAERKREDKNSIRIVDESSVIKDDFKQGR